MEYDAFQIPERAPFGEEIAKILEGVFDQKTEIEQRPGGYNQVFFYPRGEAVIRRLNEAFNSCWSFQVKERFKDEADANTIVVLGELIINHPAYPLRVIQQFAGKTIAKSKDGRVINIANDYKSAASLALRKCAMQIGVGLYLTNGLPDEDLLEGEAVEEQKGSKASNAPKTSNSTNTGSAGSKAGKSTQNAPQTTSQGGSPASSRQIAYVKSLYAKKGITEKGIDFGHLSSVEASGYINVWKDLPDAATKSATPVPKPNVAEEKATPVPASAPSPAVPEPVKPTEESADMKHFRELAAEAIGQEDIYSKQVNSFMLHVYKTNFSKELTSIDEISPRELKTLIESIDVDDDE